MRSFSNGASQPDPNALPAEVRNAQQHWWQMP